MRQNVEEIRRGRVAVIDDEPFICEIIERALGRHHDVESFSDAQALLARLEEGQRFDVIFCDLMMPGTSGRELYEVIHDSWPQMARRMVFMTGLSERDANSGPLGGLSNELIEKPFQLGRLRGVVEQMVAQR